MISMSNVGSAGGALHYFSQDNYYTQEQGLEESAWFGKGAEDLGLKGPIDKDRFLEILKGHVDGQELGKWIVNVKTGVRERDHRPGTDMTFSAPKSVSLLAEVDGRGDVRSAHEEAVIKALTYIEGELAGTRQTVDGITTTVKTGNLTVAMFRHNTSRDLDPQTHTHAVIMNATRREDGQWRSIENKALYDGQRVIGAIYISELARGLQARGYALTRTDDKGNFEIEGITRTQIEHFSQRRAAMEVALETKGIDINTATQQQKEDAALASRGRKTQVDHAHLIGEWKDRAQSVGINFTEIKARAQEHRQRGGFVPRDSLTGREAMVFAAAHKFEREVVVSKKDLLAAAIAHGAGRVGPDQVQQAFAKLARDGDLVQLPDGNYTSKKMLSSETWALEQVRAHKDTTPAIMTSGQVTARIAADEASRNAQSGRTGTGQQFSYTAGQKEALTLALTTRDRYIEVQGLAGTGKTTMLKALNAMAQDRGYVVRGMAPTGAATQTLNRESGIAADTVSMFFVKERRLQAEIAFVQKYADDFKRKPEMWIVDESSFLSQRQKSLIDAMSATAGAKVVYLGDKLQLQGVEAGKPFELAQADGITTAFMTEISRQKTPGMKRAVAIMTGHDALQPGQRLNEIELKSNARAFKFMDEAGMVKQVPENRATVGNHPLPEGALVQAVVDDVLQASRALRARTLVITPYNKDRHDINAGIRAGLRASGDLQGPDQQRHILSRPDGGGRTRAVIKEAQYYKVDDVVRIGKTYTAVDLAKDDYTRVVEIQANRGVVVLEKQNGQRIDWEPRKHNRVEVYKTEQRAIATGDLIRITRNEGDLTNGTIAEVRDIRGDTAILSVNRGAKQEAHQLDLHKNRHWDHAYASTVHAAQGTTQERVIFLMRVPENASGQKQERSLQQMAQVFADRSFYVGVTRASHDTLIYTNNKAIAAEVVGIKQDKTSAVETLKRDAQARGRDAAPARILTEIAR